MYSDAEWLDWNCRGYYLANGMEPPISQASLDARPALGLTSELLTGVTKTKPLDEMTDAEKAAARPPIQLVDNPNSTDNSGGAGNEPSDATGNGADHHSSVSVDKGKLADEPLPVGHKIFMSQDLQKGSRIAQVDDTSGVKPGMRFMLGVPPTTEIVKVLKLGSVVLTAVNSLHGILRPVTGLSFIHPQWTSSLLGC